MKKSILMKAERLSWLDMFTKILFSSKVTTVVLKRFSQSKKPGELIHSNVTLFISYVWSINNIVKHKNTEMKNYGPLLLHSQTHTSLLDHHCASLIAHYYLNFVPAGMPDSKCE